MSETFCGVCRHPTPGHEANCPVLTGEPQRGVLNAMQNAMQNTGVQQGMYWAGDPQYAPPYGVSDTDYRILMQLAVLRSEVDAFRKEVRALLKEIK
jgi:hypothetical protein